MKLEMEMKMLNLLKKSIEQLNISSTTKIEDYLSLNKKVEELEERKQEAIQIEDYESAIVFRDLQREIRRDSKATISYEILEKEVGQSSSPIYDFGSKLGDSLYSKIVQGSRVGLSKKLEELSLKSFLGAVRDFKRATILSHTSVCVPDLEAYHSIPIENKSKMIEILKSGLTQFDHSFQDLVVECQEFKMIVLRSSKFVNYLRYYLGTKCLINVVYKDIGDRDYLKNVENNIQDCFRVLSVIDEIIDQEKQENLKLEISQTYSIINLMDFGGDCTKYGVKRKNIAGRLLEKLIQGN